MVFNQKEFEMAAQIRAGYVIDGTFSFSLPCDATHQEIEEWIKFKLGSNGGMCTDNPLSEYDLEANEAEIEY